MGKEKDVPGVYRELLVRARPETVFAFLTQADRLLEWIGVSATLDPRPGGMFQVSPNGRDVISGRYVEVVANEKIVFTWGYENPGARPPPGSTTVTITLERREDGTLLRLWHSGLAGISHERHAAGWTHYLARLVGAAEGMRPGADPLANSEIVHG